VVGILCVSQDGAALGTSGVAEGPMLIEGGLPLFIVFY
jgi:hypothetical protein